VLHCSIQGTFKANPERLRRSFSFDFAIEYVFFDVLPNDAGSFRSDLTYLGKKTTNWR
jgi:hypothetical protein